MSWDSDHDYYVYSEEEDTKYDACDEECVIDLPACDEKCAIDSPAACDEECVIDPITYDAELSPAAEEVNMLFPPNHMFASIWLARPLSRDLTLDV